ncbi:MAG: hypothetical protein ABIH23_31360 [bacterium]
MNPEILRQFVTAHFEPLMLAVAGLSCGASAIFWTTYYRHRKDNVQTDGWNLLPTGIGDWRQEKVVSGESLQVAPGREVNLLKTLMYARKNDPDRTLQVEFSDGLFHFDRALESMDHLRLMGVSHEMSILSGNLDNSALTFDRVQDCLVRGFTIDGGVCCSRTDLTMCDCVIQNGHGRAAIEVTDGSKVTFSGKIDSQRGGVAIRAAGRSCVILQPPYSISDDDCILVDPGSTIVI